MTQSRRTHMWGTALIALCAFVFGLVPDSFAGRSGGSSSGSSRSSSGFSGSSFRSSPSRPSSSTSSVFSSSRSLSSSGLGSSPINPTRSAPSAGFSSSTTKTPSGATITTTTPSSTVRPPSSSLSPTRTASGFSSSASKPSSSTSAYRTNVQSKIAANTTAVRQNSESKAALDKFYAKSAPPPARPASATSRYMSTPIAKQVTPADTRTVYTTKYNTYRTYYSSPPVYISSGPSSFDMWDAMLLWSLLDRDDGPSTYYNHSSDPGFQEWQRQANSLAADNAELRAKLDTFNTKLASIPATTPVDPTYLPKGVTPAAALATDVVQAIKHKARFCGGVDGGQYNAVGNLLNASTDSVDLDVIPTHGTTDNLERLWNGQCDFALAQEDGIDVWGANKHITGTYPFEQVASLMEEETLLVCSQRSGITGVRQLDDSRTVVLGPSDSGSAVTWKSFGLEDSRYTKVKTASSTGPSDALLMVRNGQADCAFLVLAANAKVMRDADASAKGQGLKLAAVNDWDFNDVSAPSGDPLYRFVTLPRTLYPNLGGAEVIAIKANLLVSHAWKEAHPKEYSQVQSDVLAAIPEIADRSSIETSHVALQ